MKVRGDNPPKALFSVEEQPQHLGFCLVRFYANAVPFKEERDGVVSTGWEYEEYSLEFKNYDGLYSDITNNYDNYFAQAKSEELARHEIDIMKANGAKNTANIYYIAMMSNIDITGGAL